MTAFDEEWQKLEAKLCTEDEAAKTAFRRVFYLGAHSLMRAMAAEPESEHMRLMRGIQERLMDEGFEIERLPLDSDPHQPGMHGEGTFP